MSNNEGRKANERMALGLAGAVVLSAAAYAAYTANPNTLLAATTKDSLSSSGPTTTTGRTGSSQSQQPLGTRVAKQVAVNSFKYGVWGYGSLATPSSLDTYADGNIALSGYHLSVDWSDLQPKNQSEFSWTAIDDKLDQLDEQPGLRYTLQIQVGQNSPQWVMDSVGYFTTSGHSQTGPYPNYKSASYQSYYYSMLEAVSKHVSNYSSARLAKFISWQIAEGSTGDTGAYHGEPNKCYAPPHATLMATCDAYVIDDDYWRSFRIQTWHQVYDVYKPAVKLMMNIGNDAEEGDVLIDSFPGSNYKSGDLSHLFSFDSEKEVYERNNAMAGMATSSGSYRDRGEVQGISGYSWWKQSPTKLSFALVGSALAGGLDMLNWTQEGIDTVPDSRALAFFNRYSQFRKASTSNRANRGFSELRDVIDFADTTRFPEVTYLPLVADSDQKRYDSRVQSVEDQYGDSQPLFAMHLLSKATADFMNPARIEKIKSKFPNAGWEPGDGVDSNTRNLLWHDFGVNMLGNYEKFVIQIDPEGTTLPRWRVGSSFDDQGNDRNDSQMYGRYAREFKLNGSAGAMYFKVDAGLANASGSNKATISVTYFDQGTANWSIKAYGANMAIKNGNTRKFLTKTLTVNNFVFGGKLSRASDISLELPSGGNFPIALVEFENTTKVANHN